MPRKPRFFLSDVPVHIVHRGHSRSPVFFEDADYTSYLYWLHKSSEKYKVSIHAFVLMTNHVHLLVTPQNGADVSLFMQYIGRRYVPYINQKYGMSGSIWEGRYKASLVQEDHYFLSVMRYIELNPVRANMVESPSHYRWSSFCHNAGLKVIKLIKRHQIYQGLANDDLERVKAYLAFFKSELEDEAMKKINDAWLTGTPLGSDYFKDMIEAKLMCKVGQDRRGRPHKMSGKGL